MDKQILVLNSGSSSLKFALFRGETKTLWGEAENIGNKNGSFWTEGEFSEKTNKMIADHAQAIVLAMQSIKRSRHPNVDAIGHRVVFGGSHFQKPAKIDQRTLEHIKSLIPFAPLHMPHEIALIEMLQQRYPNTLQIACFDTSFHHTLPFCARLFSLPKSLREEGIQRYGFHGLSFESIVQQMKPLPKKMIVAHLGSGCSICAIKEGKSIDTSMGLTPLGGVMMGTRPGDLDPGVILYLLQQKKLSIQEIETMLYHESGLQGVSALSSDMKQLLDDSSIDSKNAVELFCQKIAKTIASYLVSLGGLDSLVFTGGIGERAERVREKILSYLKPIGLVITQEANQKHQEKISSEQSSATIFIKKTAEEQVIASHVASFLS